MFLRTTLLSLALASSLPAQAAFLGVSVQEAEDREGVLVEEVLPRSAAEVCGFQVGDEILSLAGRKTPSPDALVAAVLAHRPGEVVDIVLVRDGETRERLAVLGRRPRLEGAAPPGGGLRRIPTLREQFADPWGGQLPGFEDLELELPEGFGFGGGSRLPDLETFFDTRALPGLLGPRTGLRLPGWDLQLSAPEGWEGEREVRIRYPASTPEEERAKLIEKAREQHGANVQVEFEGEGSSIEIRQVFTGNGGTDAASAPPWRRLGEEEYDA